MALPFDAQLQRPLHIQLYHLHIQLYYLRRSNPRSKMHTNCDGVANKHKCSAARGYKRGALMRADDGTAC
jgi:hypothetical protein